MLEKLYRRYRYGDVSWTPPLTERVMRTYDKAKIRAGSAKRGVAIGFLAIMLALVGGYSMLQCSRYNANDAASRAEEKRTAPKVKPVIKKAPAKKAPAPMLADQLFRGHSPN